MAAHVLHHELHDEPLLRRWYEDEQLSLNDIASKVGCGAPSVWKAFRRIGIRMRAASAVNTPRARAKLTAANKRRGAGPKNRNWRGGRHTDAGGYVVIWFPGHEMCHNRNYVYEHRLVMAKHLGRNLTASEIVHHRNENKTDNRLDNLQLTSRREHGAIHVGPNRGR